MCVSVRVDGAQGGAAHGAGTHLRDAVVELLLKLVPRPGHAVVKASAALCGTGGGAERSIQSVCSDLPAWRANQAHTARL